MLTINEEVVKRASKSENGFSIRLRFTLNRKMKRIPTNITFSESELTKKGEIKANSPVRMQVQQLIGEYYRRCSKLNIELNNYDLDYIMAYVKGEDSKEAKIDFMKFSEELIKCSTMKSAKDYVSALHALQRFLKQDTLDIKDLSQHLVLEFVQFLIDEKTKRDRILKEKRQYVPTCRAITLYIVLLKRLFNEVRKKYNDYDNNIIVVGNNPFENVELPKHTATRKRALQPQILKQIYSLPDQTTKKGPKQTNRFNLAKDCFILSFCLIGMNSADLFYATDYDGKQIAYNRRKTKDRRLDEAKMIVEVPSIVKPIIDKYRDKTGKRVFNFHQYYSDERAFNKALNKGLKQIGEFLDIDDLEFYAARHSWATIAVNKVGIDKYTVHAALNHIDESMKVTDIYIERDFVNENKANAKVIKYVFG